MTIIPVLTSLPPDTGSWTAGPVPLHLFPGSVSGVGRPKAVCTCPGVDRLVGGRQPAGVLPKPQLFLPILIETRQDLVSVHTALIWILATVASVLTGVCFHLPEGGLKGVLGRRLAEI